MNHLHNTRFIFNKYAKAYREKYLDQSAYSKILFGFLEAIPQGGRVLDLACGPGNISRFLLDQRSDILLSGVDIAPAMVEEARKLNPEGQFDEGDVLDLSGLKEKRFDGIISGFLLPYLDTDEVILHLRQTAKALKPGGVFYLSFLEANKERSGCVDSNNKEGDTLRMNYHEEKTILQCIGQSGFTVEMGDKKTPRSENGEPTNNEIIMLLRSS